MSIENARQEQTMFDIAMEYALDSAQNEQAREYIREAWHLELVDRGER